MAKNKVYKKYDPQVERKKLFNYYNDKYYNLWIQKYKSEKLTKEQLHYVMTRYFFEGRIGSFKIKHLEEVDFARFFPLRWDHHDFPRLVRLIRERPEFTFIPIEELEVNKDVVISYIQSNHRSIREMIVPIIEKIVDVQMVINTNLNIHKIPFMIPTTPETTLKAEAIVDKVMNDEIAVFVDTADAKALKASPTGAPYIIDKLFAYKQALEGAILTYFGIDNMQKSEKEFELVDQINSNNALINANANDIDMHIQAFVKDIKEYLGVEIDLTRTQKEVTSVYDEKKQVTPGEGEGAEDE